MRFVCSRCRGIPKGIADLIKKFCNEVETVNGYCYLGDILDDSISHEAEATAGLRVGLVRFWECGELSLEID